MDPLKALFKEGLKGPNYFHNSTQILFAFSTVSIFALILHKQ